VRDAMLSELRSLGVRVALDDFGTGYSSLARLRTFPVDVLKLDRMFIAELPENSAIAHSVITLARNLGVIVIAEGVENSDQYAWLEQAGCHAAAGYLLCPPEPPEKLGAWFSARHNGGAMSISAMSVDADAEQADVVGQRAVGEVSRAGTQDGDGLGR